MSFKSKLEMGTATFDDFDDSADAWHDDKSSHHMPIFEYLGITEQEYASILKNIDYIKTLNKKYKTAVAGSFKSKVEAAYKIKTR